MIWDTHPTRFPGQPTYPKSPYPNQPKIGLPPHGEGGGFRPNHPTRAKLLHCVRTAWALHAHCVHLPGNSPKITCHLSASTAKQQSPQDNNQHMRWHMGPRAIRGVANLAPSTKLGEVQQDANGFVKGGPLAPSKYCGSRRTHRILTAMYTRETSAGSVSIAAQRQVLPHTNCYLVPGLNFEGGIFKEQQTTFLTRLVLPNLARMFNGQQQTTFLTQE